MTDDEILQAIAKRQRALLDATVAMFKTEGRENDRFYGRIYRLVDLGLVERYRIANLGTGSSSAPPTGLRLTVLGWAKVGNPPLHLCHPGTKENA